MRLEQFYQFLAVADAKSIRQASSELFMTPQNISKSLKQLEEELGVQLLIRKSSGVELTEQGQTAYAAISRIAEDVKNLKMQFGLDREEDTQNYPVEIACCAAQETFALAAWNSLYKRFQDTPVNINQASKNRFLEILASESEENLPDLVQTNVTVDSAEELFRVMKKQYRCFELYRDRIYLQAPANSSYADRKVITFQELTEVPLLLYSQDASQPSEIETVLEKQGLKLQHFSRTSSISRYTQMAFGQNRCCIVAYPSAEARPLANVVYVPIEKPLYLIQLLGIRKKAKNQRYAESYAEVLDGYFNMKAIK